MAAFVRINLLMQDDAPMNTCSESPAAVTLQFMDTRGQNWADSNMMVLSRINIYTNANLYFCFALIIFQCHNNEIKLEFFMINAGMSSD